MVYTSNNCYPMHFNGDNPAEVSQKATVPSKQISEANICLVIGLQCECPTRLEDGSASLLNSTRSMLLFIGIFLAETVNFVLA